MKYKKSYRIRQFFTHRHAGENHAPAGKGALIELGAAELSGVTGGASPTVNQLPYVLTNQAGVVTLMPVAVSPAPPLSGTNFTSLMGGGFNTLFAGEAAQAAGASAMLLTTKLLLAAKAERAVQYIANVKNQVMENIESETEEIQLRTGGNCTGPMIKHHALERLHGGAVPLDEVCQLPEQQDEEQAQEELDSLTESGEATQEDIEAAEVALEGAEQALEDAEVGLEAAEDILLGLEIIADIV